MVHPRRIVLLLQSRPITTLARTRAGGPTPLSPLIQLGRSWVIDNYPYNSTHLLKSLEWLDRLAPDASEAVRLATLTHDMERAFGGPDAIPIVMNDRAYEKAHSNRSARIVGEWLRANGAHAELVRDVEALIRVHEWGGSPDAESRAGRRQPELSRNEHRPDDGIRENGQVLEGRYRVQDRPDVRAHSGAGGQGAGAVRCGRRRRRAWRTCETFRISSAGIVRRAVCAAARLTVGTPGCCPGEPICWCA